jgi:hypothetical protein
MIVNECWQKESNYRHGARLLFAVMISGWISVQDAAMPVLMIKCFNQGGTCQYNDDSPRLCKNDQARKEKDFSSLHAYMNEDFKALMSSTLSSNMSSPV